MKTILTLLIAGFFSSAFAEDNALLYEISGNGITKPSYLYGTFHLVCPTDLQLTDTTRKALADSKQLYLEIDFDDPNLMPAMTRGMMLADGKNLKDFLKPEDYTLLDTYMQRNLGAGLATMGMLKPVGLFSVMYVTLLRCQPASYDLTFAQLAGRDGKEVLGLETWNEQLAIFDAIPLEEQLKGLTDIARRPEEAKKELTQLLEAYRAEDLTTLMKLIRESNFDGGARDFESELLSSRNNKWIPVIERAAKDQPTFFAFGAGHLGGPAGVINLLRQKGYTVRPLPRGL